MSSREEALGLHEKYLVIRRDHIIEGSEVELDNGTVRVEFIPTDPGHKKLFVLSPATDPAAFVALWTYSRFCFRRLSSDIRRQLEAIVPKLRCLCSEVFQGQVCPLAGKERNRSCHFCPPQE